MRLWRYVAGGEHEMEITTTDHHVEVVVNKLKEANDKAIRPDSASAV
jgi:hypothetical protein